MLSKIVQFSQRLIKSVVIVMAVASFFCASSAYALNVPSIADMLDNLNNSIPELMRLVTALAFVIGMGFCVIGVVGLKSYGESRGMHHEHGGAKGPLLMLAVGAALLYLPSAVHTGISTFWTNTSPLAYKPEGSGAWTDLITDVFNITKLVGTIAFIRGLIMLAHLGRHGGHQSSVGKALTHMIAGIFCINMYQFVQTVMSTLGLGQI